MEHFRALGPHLLGTGAKTRRHFNGNAGISHERRNALHNLFVLAQFLSRAQSMTGCNEATDLKVF